MTSAGVPVIPGYHGQEAASDIEKLKKEALKYAVDIIKRYSHIFL